VVRLSLFCIYRCIHLKELAISFCDSVTDAGIRMVVKGCNQLRILELRYLQSITGTCRLMKKLNIHCDHNSMVYVILGEFSTLTSKDQQCVIFNVGTIQLKSLLPFSNPPSNSLQQANKPIHHYGSLRIRTL
jgi:hypothetical protein